MIKITRLWNIEFNKIESILDRPRVSLEVDQYIWSFIYDNIVLPKKLMQSDKWVYSLVICLEKYQEDKHKFFRTNEYNPSPESIPDQFDLAKFKLGNADRLFSPTKFQTREKVMKASHINIFSPLVDNEITPAQYADLLYDGYGSFLTYNFTKVKRTELDQMKNDLSIDLINSFPFPAPFEEQKYIGDESTISFSEKFVKSEDYVISDYYKKHFGI